jgi:hypothetical protein
MRKLLAVPLLALALFATGCAAATSGGGGGSGRITAEALEAVNVQDAFMAVQRLRPQWLRSRGPTSINRSEALAVFLDNARMGGVEQLRNIPVSSIESIEYLDASEATQRWGTGYTRGAILVTTRR